MIGSPSYYYYNAAAYPGEPYLAVSLPNHEMERITLVVLLVVTFVFWIILIPISMSKDIVVVVDAVSDDNNSSNSNSNTKTQKNSMASSSLSFSPRDDFKNHSTTTKSKLKSVNKRKGGNNDNNNKRNATTLLALKEHNKISPSSSSSSTTSSSSNTTTSNKKEEMTVREVDPTHSACSALAFLFCVAWIMLKVAPDNYYTTRGVFHAPLFTHEECNHVIEMAERAAYRNYQVAQNISDTTNNNNNNNNNNNSDGRSTNPELQQPLLNNSTLQGFLQEPFGWQKTRHNSYPTTDLNLVTDPFTKQDRAWLKEKLDARLAPTISRLFGIPQGAIRAGDLFVVRYDGDRRASLTRHTDSGDVTFAALLSEGFEGGGTRYWNRDTDKPFGYIRPEIGHTALFPAVISHEGVQVHKGRRYLLIGFLNVDRHDPFTLESTGLSWFASWGSLNWALVRFKAGYESARYNMGKGIEKWTSQKYVRGFFAHMIDFLYAIGDVTMPHFYVDLVQQNRTMEYFESLDKAYASGKRPVREASWFKGQLTNVDIDGTVNSYTSTRRNNLNLFQEDRI